jgi:hypothetical protein
MFYKMAATTGAFRMTHSSSTSFVIYGLVVRAHGSWVYSAFNKNEYRKISGGEARPARKDEKLTAIYEPTAYKMWDPRHLTAF